MGTEKNHHMSDAGVGEVARKFRRDVTRQGLFVNGNRKNTI